MPFSRALTFFSRCSLYTKSSSLPVVLVSIYILKIKFQSIIPFGNINYPNSVISVTDPFNLPFSYCLLFLTVNLLVEAILSNFYYIQIVVKKMREGVLPLNIVIAVFYLALATAAVFILKKSSRCLKKMIKIGEEETNWKEQVDHNKLIASSWVKKYSIFGAFLQEDKKYLLKEFLFVAAYSVACLHINHVIMWPAAYSLFLLPLTFALFDILLKKIYPPKVESETAPQIRQQKKNAMKNQAQSQIQIQSVNIEAIPQISCDPLHTVSAKPTVKQEQRINRSNYQLIINSGIGLSSVLMLFQTVATLTNSTSNSGELNITSVLIIFCIDQFAIRPAAGLITFAVIKIMQRFSEHSIMETFLVSSLCQEELREVMAVINKQRKRKQVEMTASPPRRKQESPSRVPKAALAEHPTYLNLISLQPTRRKTEQQEEQDVSAGLEQIYLTTLEQELFVNGEQLKGGGSTKRKSNKENRQHSYLSAVQKFTIEQEMDDQIEVVKQDPLQQCQINRVGAFNQELSPVSYTKRRAAPVRRKHKRVLNLTGSSPYLEYLPDMLKNVEKFKQTKQNRVI